MKIILSRKGFDSGYGGCASPIFPDGSMVSLPIPDNLASHKMSDIPCPFGEHDLEEVTRDLVGGRHPDHPFGKNGKVHLDPYLLRPQSSAPHDWRPAYGQDGMAQIHLAHQQVEVGDIFLFFGWYRRVEKGNAPDTKQHWQCVRGAPNMHVLFGWLQVGEVITVGSRPTPGAYPAWLADHPHIQDANRFGNQNTIYVAAHDLVINNKPLGLPGGGTFTKYADALRLTHPDSPNRSIWQLPRWFMPSAGTGKPTLSFHPHECWDVEPQHPQQVKLRTRARGQEFVLGGANHQEQRDWLSQLFRLAQNQPTKPGVHPPATDGDMDELRGVQHAHDRQFRRVNYDALSPRQQENFNFQKVSSVLADCGYMTLRLSSDWEGADFIAQHMDGTTFLKVQLKSRFTIDKKYQGKDLHICFPDRAVWYLCPHDLLVAEALRVTTIGQTDSWGSAGCYHARQAPSPVLAFLKRYALGPVSHE